MLNISQPNIGKILQRRKASLIVPVVVGAALALVAYKTLPPQYRATTTIMVEAQQVPEEYVKTTVSTSTTERLDTIEQQISSRAPLRLIIEELDLYPEEQGRVPEQLLIQKARNSLSVRVSRGTVFSIGFKSEDPQKAAAAANRIADLFIQENLRLRESQAQNTSAFLDAETADLKQKVQVQQDRIVEFTRLHQNELPEQKPLIMQAIGQLEDRLEILGDSIHNAELRKLVLETNAGRPLPEVGKAKESPRLASLRAEKEKLLLQYTEKHPDVMALQAEIDAVLAQEAQGRGRTADGGIEPAASVDDPGALAGDGSPSGEESAGVDDPAGEGEIARPVLLAEIDKVTSRIEGLEQEREEVLNSIATYQARLERIPRVAQEFNTLSSDFDNLKRKLRSLQAKQLEAQLAENLERSQQAEQFRILDRAIPPLKPYFPNLFLLLGVGIATGTLVGMIVGIAREQADETFLDSRSLRKAFPGVDITASIPKIPEAIAGTGNRLGLRKRRIA
jgi:polysaccharide chain length determinant protein (PEP-CTERM system associated)